MPTIWIDADATPKVVREIICKAAIRTATPACFVANHRVPVTPSPHIRCVQVEPGFDVADNLIAQQAQTGDLVITQDIPLAAEVMENKVDVINNRGETYNPQTIRQKLQMRDFMETMRASGEHTGGPPPLNKADRKAFADQLDRILTRAQQA